MPDTKMRVHRLAKDLGVTSKAIIAKCHAEDIEIPNHMFVLTAGLEATIREWFSDGAHTTTVERAARVDLERVRRPRRKKVAAKTAAAKEGEDAAQSVEGVAAKEAAVPVPTGPPEPVQPDLPAVTTEPPVEAAPPVSAPPSEIPTGPPVEVPAPAEREPAVRPAAEAPQVQESPAVQSPSVAAPEEALPPAVPVAPAGPKNVPRPAQLQGPRVVRIERPDIIVRSPPPPPRSGGPSPIVSPPVAPPPKRRGAVRGREGEAEDGRAAARRGAVRTRVNPRRSGRDAVMEVGEKLREWRDRDLLERRERLEQASGRTHRAVETRREQAAGPRPVTRPTKVEITEPVVLKEFCRVTGVRFDQVMPKLLAQGMVASLNRTIDAEAAQLLAMEFGIELVVQKAPSPLDALRDERAQVERKRLLPRPPIVTILGHVDHGKTSLLDRIRRTHVAPAEAGGITQHIGAYQVKTGDRCVTFLDTPGHAAFTTMRARGAHVTDVVVLVVAADDGVMPQTIEAVNHARAASVPIVVALNKIDLPGIDVNKVYGQLAEQGLLPQQWGGDTDVIHTSATTGEGIDELLEHLAALSDLLELKADAGIAAAGTVIESEKKEGVGHVARVMVREGTLRRGDVVVCGPAYGKVRLMQDERGGRLSSAGPATPVEIMGLNDLPQAGDEFFVVDSVQRAKAVAEDVARQRREAELLAASKPTDLSALLAAARGERLPELNIILRADVQGSVDVLQQMLSGLSSEQVKLNILHAGVGAISEGDVMLAAASQAIVVGFNVVAEPAAQRCAEAHRVDLRFYRVIYELEDDIRRAMAGLLPPAHKLETRGRAEVREVFNITRVGRVAGCFVREGLLARGHRVRIVRDSVPVKDQAALASLRRFKDDVREVRAGLECGLRIEGFDDVKPGDVIEAYELIEVPREVVGTSAR